MDYEPNHTGPQSMGPSTHTDRGVGGIRGHSGAVRGALVAGRECRGWGPAGV